MMTRRRFARIRSLWTPVLAVPLLATVAVACGDGNSVTAPAARAGDAAADGGGDASAAGGDQSAGVVSAGLVAGAFGEAEGTQTVVLRISGEDGRLGAYQGRLSFDAGRLTLVDARGSQTGFHTVNDLEAATGRLRFAGFAARGFGAPEVLTLTFETDRPLQVSDLSLSLQVVGDVRGVQVPDRAIAVAPLRDAAPEPPL